MTIPANVYNVRYGGHLPGGEQWESGFWVLGALPTSNALANTAADLWYAQLTAADGSGAARISLVQITSAATTIEYVRVYVYPAGGSTAAFIGEHLASNTYGTGTQRQANQVALVVTLKTDAAGRRHRGRMYLPCTAASVQADGQLTTAVAGNVATAWGLCFSDWNTSGDNGEIVVVSRVGAGSATAVTAVSVDTIPDTQRRRRNKMTADGRQTALVTAA